VNTGAASPPDARGEGGRPRPIQPRGAVLLQGFKLADGAACLKLQFSWAGTETTAAHAIFASLVPTGRAKPAPRRECDAGPPAGAAVTNRSREEHAVARWVEERCGHGGGEPHPLVSGFVAMLAAQGHLRTKKPPASGRRVKARLATASPR